MNRGFVRGDHPPLIPPWMGGGNPANDGYLLGYDTSLEGGAGPVPVVSSGQELGAVIDSTRHSALTSTADAALTGFTKTVIVPATGRPVYVSWNIPLFGISTTAGQVTFVLYEDGVSLAAAGGEDIINPAASAFGSSHLVNVRRTPSAGSHTYAVFYHVAASMSLSVYGDLANASLTIVLQ